jgi:hypothetical protein
VWWCVGWCVGLGLLVGLSVGLSVSLSWLVEFWAQVMLFLGGKNFPPIFKLYPLDRAALGHELKTLNTGPVRCGH